LKHGLDFTGREICRFEPNGSSVIVRNINFNRCAFGGTQGLDDIVFHDCSFRNARLSGLSNLATFGDTDFSDARIENIGYISLTRKQLESTYSFKQKYLLGITFSGSDLQGTDFSGFTLKNMGFGGTSLRDCIFTDAVLEGCNLGYKDYGMTFEMLQSTWNYKNGNLINLGLNIVWPEGCADFSKMTLTGCVFGSEANCQLDLTDSVITNCDFRNFKGLTLENVKSTWNYKHGRMAGIKLPEEIQKALDTEQAEL
jgi:uncharacterized protein YjbI with pentapeptide repeats